MKKAIKNLEIKNFKSIRHLNLECGRINLFVGKPNVGKSNILEALSLYGAFPYCRDKDKYLSEFVRYENFANVFYDNDLQKQISVKSNIGIAQIRYFYNANIFDLILSPDEELLNITKDIEDFAEIQKTMNINRQVSSNKGDVITPFHRIIDFSGSAEIHQRGDSLTFTSPVKKYSFKSQQKFSDRRNFFLIPPYGENLITILETNRDFRKFVSEIFEEYNLEFVIDPSDQKIEIQKKVDGLAFKVPYSLMADTLQRIIFHYAAIESNKDSILLFEEPENHSFPPYIRSLAEKIVESKDNQFFITTHSPYLFNTLISDTKKGEVAVFITTFDNHETKVKKLSEEELSEILDYGVDVFFNLKHFENE